ncbi:MAG: DNA polymerase I, partial [Selenomonadaceae bacterium]|nr:DNA polymerase I [Selenomonadaceae bacterium]
KTATTLIKTFGTLENILDRRADVKQKKARAALENYSDDAIKSKQLAKIVRDVPGITFNAEDFTITPNLTRADEFCDRYALAQVKKKIHELFGETKIFFDEPTSTTSALEVQPIDFQKIFAAHAVTIAQLDVNDFAIKVLGGEIFSATRDDVQNLFDMFGGKIILSDVKNFLHTFHIADLAKIFDAEIAAYLLYPERDKAIRNEELGIRNVVALEEVATRYESELTAANLTKLYREMELPLTEVLARMEERGVFVDVAQLEKKSADMTSRIAALEEKIYELAGETFNINSPKQLADVLFVSLKLPPVKKTKTGYSTNAEVLEELKWRHPIVATILDFRALTKLKSTYLDGLAKLIGSDGRVHTNFNQTVTATGRLSSSDPNLQNIPVRTDEGREIRALFEPGAGFDCILSADYSQIELRLWAHMSGDKNLIDAFNRGQDIHARTAAEVFGVSLDEITPDLRRKAKAVNFGIVYGISDYGLSRDLHISRKEAGEYITRYFEKYPGVKNFLDETVAKARKLGYVTTMFGRRRTLPAINSPNFNLRSFAERTAMNTPIQGTAADIIKLAMIRAEENLRGLKSRIIIQVHDELVLEAKTSELAVAEKILRDAMENVANLSVPLVVDVHSGKNWSLAK